MLARPFVLLAGIAIPLALWLVLPLVSSAGLDERARRVDRQISRKEGLIARQRGRERRLQGQVVRYSRTIGRLQDRLGGLRSREGALQADLDARLSELAAIQEDLRGQRALLVRLRTRLTVSRRVLGDRLVELYKAGGPDIVTVVLDSNGFADLLERSEFLGRVSRQDRRVIQRVILDRAQTTRTTKRLAGLEGRQRNLARQILARRNAVASVRERVVAQRDNFAGARSARNGLLSGVRGSRREAQEDVAALRRESARVTKRLQALGAGPSTMPGPAGGGSGLMVWPVTGTITSPFCERRSYESCHPGIDIAAPTGTPIRAASTGRVVIAGPQGAYGNFTCVQHTSAVTSCYGHQSSIGVSVGQRVRQGQVIGAVGSTGRSTGPHLHWEVRLNGSPVDPANYL